MCLSCRCEEDVWSLQNLEVQKSQRTTQESEFLDATKDHNAERPPLSPNLSKCVDPCFGISFPLRSYLEDDNRLERRLIGQVDENLFEDQQQTLPARSGEQRHSPQMDIQLAPDAAALVPSVGLVRSPSLPMPPLSAAVAHDGADAIANELMSLGSNSPPSSVSSTASSTFSSCQPTPDHSFPPSGTPPRHTALIRQLEQAGLPGVGGKTNRIGFYHE